MTEPYDSLKRRYVLKTQLPPTLRNKGKRFAWQIVYHLVFRPSPVPLHAWRRAVLRMFGAEIGVRTAVYPTTIIWAPWNLRLGDGVTIGGGVNLYAVDIIRIDDDAIVSQGAHLCTASHHHNSATFDLVTARIHVARNGWVAAEAFIGPGVVIGEGAVVAARSVVVRSVDAREVVAGNPARVVSRRAEGARNRLAGRLQREPR